jgi:hypothetical protein
MCGNSHDFDKKTSHNLTLCLSVCLSVCLSIDPSVCLSIHPSTCLSLKFTVTSILVCLSVSWKLIVIAINVNTKVVHFINENSKEWLILMLHA